MRDSVKILGYDFLFKIVTIDIKKLCYYPHNPRLYSIYRTLGYNFDRKLDDENEQKEIYKELLKRPHVQALIKDIKENEGSVREPLIVIDKTFQVLEGNSRLAACTWLCRFFKNNGDKTKLKRVQKLRCQIVPHNIPRKATSGLMVGYHIVGKTVWNPYDKACHARYNVLVLRQEGYDINDCYERVGKEMQCAAKDVKVLCGNIVLMDASGEKNPKKYSYFNVMNDKPSVRNKVQSDLEFQRKLFEFIKKQESGDDEINTAVATDLRRMLKFVVTDDEAIDFFKKTLNIEKASDIAEAKKFPKKIVYKLKSFLDWLVDNETTILSEKEDKEIFREISTNIKDIKNKIIQLYNILLKK